MLQKLVLLESWYVLVIDVVGLVVLWLHMQGVLRLYRDQYVDVGVSEIISSDHSSCE